MIAEFNQIKKISGELFLAGDKSISHRAVLFSALANGKSVIRNISNGADVQSSLNCIEVLGAKIFYKKEFIEIEGNASDNKKLKIFDAGNSGTTARLLAGILINQKYKSRIIGDDSLSSRPMKRIIEPLSLMGGIISSNNSETLPIEISPSQNICAVNYELKIPSAQVKSSILIAGLFLKENTCVIENEKTRNHTEIMLGLKCENKFEKNYIYSSKSDYPIAKEYFIPSDISSASFFIVLTMLSKKGNLIIKNVSLNKTRIGFLKLLKRMGGNMEIINKKKSCNEEYGDIVVSNSNLHNIKIEKKIIPNIIDEIPILAVAGLFADGDFEIRNAKELRVKESDRIKSICHNLRLLNLNVEEYEDGFKISSRIKKIKPVFESFNDHRIAMAFSILTLLLEDGGKINNFDCVKISNPIFIKQLKSITR